MPSRAFAAYLGALTGLASPVPLSGDPAPPLTSAGHSLRKGALVANAARHRGPEAAANEGAAPETHTREAGARSLGATDVGAPASRAGHAASPAGGASADGTGAAHADTSADGAGAAHAGARADGTGAAHADGGEAAGPLDTTATLFNVHSGEALVLDARGPNDERFSRLMPDRTNGEVRGFDARLLVTLRRVAERHPGARIELVSGYRSPKFNEQLRKKGHRVASHSEHSRGHALDIRVEGLSPAELVAELRAVGWKGGLGRYDRPGDRFVHFDVGRERFWMGR